MPEFYIDKNDKGYFLTRNCDGKQTPVDHMGQPGNTCYYETLKAIKISCERLEKNAGPVERYAPPKKVEKVESKDVPEEDI